MGKVGTIFREGLANAVKEGIRDNQSTFLVSYSALSSSELGLMRKELKAAGAQVYVLKNRVTKFALKDLKQEKFSESITGQAAFVWSNADSSVISRTLVKYTKEFEEKLIVQGGILDGAILEKADVKRLADLPAREVLLSHLLSVIQSPITSLMGAMNAKTRDLLSILKQLSEKKGGNQDV